MNCLRAALLAALLLSLQIGFDQWERHYGITGAALYLDEALVALLFSGLVMHLAHRRKMDKEQQQSAIRAMNHNVRNALQSILYAHYLGAEDRQKQQITESVGRIERAVWEISNGVESRLRESTESSLTENARM